MYSYWIFFILVIVFLTLLNNKEKFAVAFNEKEVDGESQETIYQRETKEIKRILHQRINNSDYPRDYKTYYMIDPIFEKSEFGEYIKKNIQMTFNKHFFNTILENTQVINKIYNVYTRYDIYLDVKHIICNIDAINTKLGFTRKFLIYIVLNNMSEYISNRGEIYPILNSIYDDIDIRYIMTQELEQEMSVDFYQDVVLKNQDSNINMLYDIRNSREFIQQKYDSSKIDNDDKIVLEKKLEDRQKPFIVGEGQCFGAKADNREECIKNYGVWDKKIMEDNECPYYKANINYPNTYGKIKLGVCELPANMKSVGYRSYSKDAKDIPLCYNCKYNKINIGTLGYCCDDQLTNKVVYPNLSSPDYAYVGDKEERKKWASVLTESKLSVE